MDFFDYFGETSAKKVRNKLLDLLDNEKEFNKFKDALLASGQSLKEDVFMNFFQAEIAERKNSKQDYTPAEVAKLLFMLNPDGTDYYDPTGGTGSLLIEPMNQGKCIHYTELDEEAYKFAQLNAKLRGIPTDTYVNGDALDISDGKRYDAVISNPPYSIPYNPDEYNYSLFDKAGKKAPKSKADLAFISMIVDRLSENGTAVVLLPHGVLFRGSSEGALRQALIESNLLDAVIGLPNKLFFGTDIPTVALVIKKNRTKKDVLFIDASNDYYHIGAKNHLREDDLNKVVKAYNERVDMERYAHVATFAEIKENYFNCNIPRYVDTFEPEESIDLQSVLADIEQLNEEEERISKELEGMMSQLVNTKTREPAFDEKALKTMSLLERVYEQRDISLRKYKQGLLQRMFV